MTIRDLVTISGGNLTRMKLRTFLTSAGVLIAIAAFVSMLSFGAGNQEYIEKQFNEFGLFSTMQVFPKGPDSTSAAPSTPPGLDEKAIERLAQIPGVNLVYPYDAFNVRVKVRDTVLSSKAEALPALAMSTKLFSRFAAGSGFENGDTRKVILSEEFTKSAGIAHPDSIIGRTIVLSVRRSTIDSGLAHIVRDRGELIFDRMKGIHFDSLLRRREYRNRIIRSEASEIARRFVSGFLTAQAEIAETLTVCGVRNSAGRMGRLRIEPVIIPIPSAARLTARGFGSSPVEIFTAMQQGTLFAGTDSRSAATFPQVTIDFDPKVYYKTIADSVEALGFRTFSFAAQFQEIQRVFLYFNLALALIGLIALTTASLGIVNTMVMSITERRREIGILKSLGADEGDIRSLFLAESAAIGLLGTTGGIGFGWIIARVASAVAQGFMTRQGVPAVDLFALPVWLILIALCVGVSVSIVAGYYPASRAARIDPVAALRND